MNYKKLIEIILSIIGVIIIIFIFTYFFLFKSNKIERIENRLLNKSNIRLSDQRLNDLLTSIPFVSLIDNNIYKDAYNGKKITIDNIDINILLLEAYHNSNNVDLKKNKPTLNKVLKSNSKNKIYGKVYKRVYDIKSYLKKYYGIKKIDLPSVLETEDGISYLVKDYYVSEKSLIIPKYNMRRKTFKYFKDEEELIIEEEVLFMDVYHSKKDKLSDVAIYKNTYDLYNNENEYTSINIPCSLTYNKDKEPIDKSCDYSIVFTSLINKSYARYKHTFIKKNGIYTWYSSEMI